MSLKAGAARVRITPPAGTDLLGYGTRHLTAIHDDLHVRALVLEQDGIVLALCSVEVLWMPYRLITEVRARVQEQIGIPAQHLHLFATHTHSAPPCDQIEVDGQPLASLAARAIREAYEARRPARIGSGGGMLFGYSLNRRWLDLPVDPCVTVLRVDHADGTPLAVLTNFGCHAVVMGEDNVAVSGDYPGYASRLLEAETGAVALFSQGGAGDINPLTETVRQHLAAGHPVKGLGELGAYYDAQPDTPRWNIGDRRGGTFLEAETIARALHTEVRRIVRALSLKDRADLWSASALVPGEVEADEPPASGLTPRQQYTLGAPVDSLTLEVSAVRIGDLLITTQPGEVFSETAVHLRRHARRLGFPHAMLISYADGNFAYLPPESAFDEGGYEVMWPRAIGISRRIQSRIEAALERLTAPQLVRRP